MSGGDPVVVAVASGKGGVGKSTVSLNLALALQSDGVATGLLDADLYGPDIPLMLGVTRRRPTKGVDVWSARRRGRPIEPLECFGIKVMSSQFLVAEDQALNWSSPLVSLLLQRFTTGVAWGDIRYLIVDLPPGTADVQQQLTRSLNVAGALVVVTPQDAAHLDAKKVLTMLAQLSVPVIGGVENMSALVCPTCATAIDVFPPVAQDRAIWHLGVDRLAKIPIEPAVAGVDGAPLLVAKPDSPVAKEFLSLAERVRTWAQER